MGINIIWIKYHENDIVTYPYFTKNIGASKINYNVYLVGESGKNIQLFVDHIDTFFNMEEIEKKSTDYLKGIKDIKEYLYFESENRCKKVHIDNLSFMNKIRRTCLARIENYEDFCELSENDRKLFSETEVEIFKTRSEWLGAAKTRVLEMKRQEAVLMEIIRNANKEILERDPEDPAVANFHYKKIAAQEELERIKKGE